MVVNALVKAYSGLHDRFDVYGIIFQARELGAFYDYCSNVLVAEYRAAAAASCLLEPYGLPADVIEAEVETYNIARLCSHACRND